LFAIGLHDPKYLHRRGHLLDLGQNYPEQLHDEHLLAIGLLDPKHLHGRRYLLDLGQNQPEQLHERGRLFKIAVHDKQYLLST
jgi:hypothetical protein